MSSPLYSEDVKLRKISPSSEQGREDTTPMMVGGSKIGNSHPEPGVGVDVKVKVEQHREESELPTHTTLAEKMHLESGTGVTRLGLQGDTDIPDQALPTTSTVTSNRPDLEPIVDQAHALNPDADPDPELKPGSISSKKTDPMQTPDEPLEEYSRAITHPDRVVLLRQSRTRIWITSIYPSSSCSTTLEDQDLSETRREKEEEERRLGDLRWFADYFQLPGFHGLDASVPCPNPDFTSTDQGIPSPRLGAGTDTDMDSRPSGTTEDQSPPTPLRLTEQYRHWKALDPLLFGKAFDRGELPEGVRVVRQEGWECLIS